MERGSSITGKRWRRGLKIFLLLITWYCNPADAAEECNTKDDPTGLQYTGTVSKTFSGIPCQRWDSLSPHRHRVRAPELPDDTLQAAENHCRNTDPGEPGPYCMTTDPSIRKQRCHIPSCDCKSEDDELGKQYQGTRNTTISGRACQRWDVQTPHAHNKTADKVPDDTLEAAENFCRSADKSPGGPWCYTTDPGEPWEYCDIPTCECSVSLTQATDTFISPKWTKKNSAYPANLNCSWTIFVEEGKVVSLYFENFKLQESEGCHFDSVTIYDGSSMSDSVLGKYCGENVPSQMYSTGNTMLVTFRSDATVPSAGFKATYTTREKRNETDLDREAEEALKNQWEHLTRDEIARDYYKEIPALGNSPVHVGYTLTKIINVNEKAEEISLAVYLNLWWRDERVVYNKPEQNESSKSETAYDHGRLIFTLAKIWFPNVVHYNNAGDGNAEIIDPARKAITDGTGVMYWSKNLVLTSPCDMDVTFFPVDTQVCDVVFSIEPQGPVKIAGDVKTDPNATFPDSAWSIRRENIIRLNNNYLTVTFRQTFNRKHQYYITRILGPVAIISVLVICVFFLPPDAGEKVGLGVTLLLTFSVFQMMVDDELPASSTSTPLITRAMILLQLCSALSIVASVLVLHVHHITSEKGNQVPRLLRWLFFNVLAKLTFHTGDVRRVTGQEKSSTKVSPAMELAKVDYDYYNHRNSSIDPMESKEPEPGKQVMLLNEIKILLNDVAQKMSGSDDDNTVGEWKLLALILDRMLMYMCVLTMAGVYIALFAELQQQR